MKIIVPESVTSIKASAFMKLPTGSQICAANEEQVAKVTPYITATNTKVVVQ